MEHRRTETKLALKPAQVWGIRIRLQMTQKRRDLALLDLALDSKLRACDVVALRVSDLVSGGRIRGRVMILQRKTGRPVQFEITEQTRRSLTEWLDTRSAAKDDWIFRSRSKLGAHVTTRQYARLLKRWVGLIGLNPAASALTACAGARSRSPTRRPATCVRVSFSWATQSLRAPSGTSAWKSTTLWSYRRP